MRAVKIAHPLEAARTAEFAPAPETLRPLEIARSLSPEIVPAWSEGGSQWTSLHLEEQPRDEDDIALERGRSYYVGSPRPSPRKRALSKLAGNRPLSIKTAGKGRLANDATSAHTHTPRIVKPIHGKAKAKPVVPPSAAAGSGTQAQESIPLSLGTDNLVSADTLAPDMEWYLDAATITWKTRPRRRNEPIQEAAHSPSLPQQTPPQVAPAKDGGQSVLKIPSSSLTHPAVAIVQHEKPAKPVSTSAARLRTPKKGRHVKTSDPIPSSRGKLPSASPPNPSFIKKDKPQTPSEMDWLLSNVGHVIECQTREELFAALLDSILASSSLPPMPLSSPRLEHWGCYSVLTGPGAMLDEALIDGIATSLANEVGMSFR